MPNEAQSGSPGGWGGESGNSDGSSTPPPSNVGEGMGPGYHPGESGVPGGWGATQESGTGGTTSSTTPSEGTYTDAQGRPITREQAILSGRTDAPGVSQFERIQGLSPGLGPTPPPQSGPSPELQPRTEILIGPKPGEYGYHATPINPAGLGYDPYWAIHRQDEPRSDIGGKIFAGGSPIGKFLEAIQSPSLAYEYLKFDINTIMGESPSDIGILQARETFLETVNARRESYGLPGAAAIGVTEIMPVQAYAGGALFKGGTLALRVGLRGTSSAIGSNIVARGLLASEKAVEPLAIVGGAGIAGKELATTYQTEGGAGAAAQATIMAGSLPFAMAGWKKTGNLYSKILVHRRTEVTAPVSPEVLRGEHSFPTTEPGTTPNELISGFKTDKGLRGYHATGESLGKEVTVANSPKRPSDVGGLYVSPYEYGTSPHFLRVNTEYSGGIKEFLKGFLQSEPLNPTVMNIQLKDVGRLPKDIRYLPKDPTGRYSVAREFMGESAEPGKAYLTPKLENTLSSGGAAEAEAVISPGTSITRIEAAKFFKYKGRSIPIDEFAASGEGVAATSKATISETGNYGYRRTTIPPISSNIVSSFNMPTLPVARAEATQEDYIAAYNAAREAARQQTYGNDITAVHQPKSPGRVDTLRGKKHAEDLANTIIKDLKSGGMNVEYNKRTATIEKVSDSFNQAAEPVLDIVYFNKAKDQRSTAFDKGFASEDLTGMNAFSVDLRKTQQPGDLSILAKYYGNNPADVPILFPDVEFGGRSENFNKQMRYRKTRKVREDIRESSYRPNSGTYTPPRRTDRITYRPEVPAPYRPDYGRPGRPYDGTFRTPPYKPPTIDIKIPGIPGYPKKKSNDTDENTAEIKINNKYFRTARKSPIAAASIDLSGIRKAMGIATPKRRRGRK
ncbi:MAG: hypothetical protein C3F06_02470 [Candidatus Methanoperedenaceae archaeon]|nr:MAG: hypothetical protein C3F06_02470 [Candidatus Methanoperedenaceae archaeon]